MTYITTKVKALKSYPTYQFYAAADSKSQSVDNVFKICILETLRWIRSRLQGINDLPHEINTPEPEQFADFSDDQLASFSYNDGFQIDVIFIDNVGIWSFRMTEPDMGANIGTKNERLPVNGRSFTTEIAFRKQDKYVEIGIRTICSEPADTECPCEVFRPRVVKALVENSNLSLYHYGSKINGRPLEINNKNNFELFLSFLSDHERCMPMVVIADNRTEIKESKPIILPQITPSLSNDKLSLSGFSHYDTELNVTISADKKDNKKVLMQSDDKIEKNKKIRQTTTIQPPSVKTKPEVLDYCGLAQKLIGFAIVVFVSENYLSQFRNKTHISINYGDIQIISGQQPTDVYSYSQYNENMQDFFWELRSSVIDMQKRAAYSFGNILFYSDAKLKEFHAKRQQTNSLEEKCSIYKQEKAELKSKIKELSQQQTDMMQTAESLRVAQKRIELLERELENKTNSYNELAEQAVLKENAYKKSADLIRFYREMIDIVELFPKDKNSVCDWIEEKYSEDIYVASRAKSEMKKYNGQLDVNTLCDGIVYLSAYAKYRRNELAEDIFDLYAERNHWEIQGCGKEALKMHQADYTVTIDGKQYLLDQHIKRGVHAEELIRIYFCWDDNNGKIIIGSMPEHLATTKSST